MIDRIREIREKIFKTQSNMADCLGLKAQNISDYERGKAFFRPATVSLLINKYNINSNWLFTGRGNMLLSDNDKVNNNDIIQQLQDRVKELEIENKVLKELIKK